MGCSLFFIHYRFADCSLKIKLPCESCIRSPIEDKETRTSLEGSTLFYTGACVDGVLAVNNRLPEMDNRKANVDLEPLSDFISPTAPTSAPPTVRHEYNGDCHYP